MNYPMAKMIAMKRQAMPERTYESSDPEFYRSAIRGRMPMPGFPRRPFPGGGMPGRPGGGGINDRLRDAIGNPGMPGRMPMPGFPREPFPRDGMPARPGRLPMGDLYDRLRPGPPRYGINPPGGGGGYGPKIPEMGYGINPPRQNYGVNPEMALRRLAMRRAGGARRTIRGY